MGPFGAFGIHSLDFFADKIEQVPAYAETQMRLIQKRWAGLDAEIADGRSFIAGDAFSMADIMGAAALMIASFMNYQPKCQQPGRRKLGLSEANLRLAKIPELARAGIARLRE